MVLRNRLYDRGIFRSYSLGCKTISIGNLTAGGTGKTPLVALVVEILSESGEKVCVLTRGYGRKNAKDRVLVSDSKQVLADAVEGGDEPVELARKLLGKAVVIADADRVSAAKWAREKFGITAFVLDDGFQHRRAKRDLDIVCIDATNPCGNGRILPAGTLRESFKELKRAGAIVITRTNLVESTGKLIERLRRRNPDAPIHEAATRVCRVTDLKDFAEKKLTTGTGEHHIPDMELYAFCGLGNPDNFRRQLEIENFPVKGFRSFADHHWYVRADVESLEKEAAHAGAKALITTAKDAVKLNGLTFEMPLFVAEAEVIVNDKYAFRKLILAVRK